MKCLLDIDGVLGDFMGAAHEYYDMPFDHGDDYPYEMGDYNAIPPKSAKFTAEEWWDGLEEEFWVNMPWTTDGREIVSRCEAVFGPKNVCLLTNPPSCGLSGRMKWIKRELPQYKDRFLIGPAKEFCAGPGTVLIDDYDVNIDTFRAAGGFAVQPPKKWNRRHAEFGKDWLCQLDYLPIIRG
jgi:hypothetical protein